MNQLALVVSVLFRTLDLGEHTSEVELALFEGVEVGEGVVEEFGCKAHCVDEEGGPKRLEQIVGMRPDGKGSV